MRDGMVALGASNTIEDMANRKAAAPAPQTR